MDALIGKKVAVIGMENSKRPELNGKEGKIAGFQSNGLVRVSLKQSGKGIAIAPKNLDFIGMAVGTLKQQAKDLLIKSVAREEPLQCGYCGLQQNPTLTKSLASCSRCHTVRYCGKECQRADWKKHKKVCNQMTQEWAKNSLANILGSTILDHEPSLEESAANPTIMPLPRHYFAASPALTGYPKELLVACPLWDDNMEEMKKKEESPTAKKLSKTKKLRKKHMLKSIEKSARFFFEADQAGGAQWSGEDLANICIDCFLLNYYGKTDLVRKVSPKEYFGNGKKPWKNELNYFSQIPPGWSYDREEALASGVPADVIDRWDAGMKWVTAQY